MYLLSAIWWPFGGDRVHFWTDIWCGNSSFCEKYPLLFAIATDKQSLVSDNYDIQGIHAVWSPILRRAFHEEEVQMFSAFMMQLAEYYIVPTGRDVRVWSSESKGIFSVKSFYSYIAGGTGLFKESYIWRIPAPFRILAFCWVVRLHRVLTIDNLQKHNHILANSSILCLRSAEDVHHVFLHCSFTTTVWHAIFQLFGISWVMPCTVKELFDHWKYGFGSYGERLFGD